MSIKATAQVKGVSPYDESNCYTTVSILAMRNGEYMDSTVELFVLPISTNFDANVRSAVRTWLTNNWGVSFGLLDTVQLLGGSSVL